MFAFVRDGVVLLVVSVEAGIGSMQRIVLPQRLPYCLENMGVFVLGYLRGSSLSLVNFVVVFFRCRPGGVFMVCWTLIWLNGVCLCVGVLDLMLVVSLHGCCELVLHRCVCLR